MPKPFILERGQPQGRPIHFLHECPENRIFFVHFPLILWPFFDIYSVSIQGLVTDK